MRLFELNFPKTKNDALFGTLANLGWHHLNSGGFGDIYYKEGSPYILKLFDNRDKAYISFIELANNYPNIHFPKFRGKLMRVNNNYSAIRLEKLEKLDVSSFEQLTYIVYYLKYRNYSSDEFNYNFKLQHLNQKYNKKLFNIRFYMQENPEMKIACDLICDNLLNKYRLDLIGSLEEYNIMKRADGTLVFTDPVSI